MATKAKHAFGSLESVESALAAGKIDAYDILFLDGDTAPKVGWIDANGVFRLVETEADFSELEAVIATKANASDVEALEQEVATKASTEEVETKINEATQSSVETAKSYTDEVLEAALGEYLAKKYVVAYKPEGTIVNYRDKEIRVLVPDGTQFELQESGEGANANMYYIGFKAYAPDDATSFKEDLAETIADETMYYFEGNEFAGVDDWGKYSIVWLPVAIYDESSDTWTYYGASSSVDKYIGWYYSVEWYDADGVVIASDSIRINLSNEDCHSSIKPYYVGEVMKDANAYTDAQIEAKMAELGVVYEVVEF